MTTQIEGGNIGTAVNSGISGISGVIPNPVAQAALQSAAATTGNIVDASVAGNVNAAIAASVQTVANSGVAVQQVVNGITPAPVAQTNPVVAQATPVVQNSASVIPAQQVIPNGLPTTAPTVVAGTAPLLEADSLPNVAGTTHILQLKI